ncbi:MAG: G8 domain-containing protein, partial [Bacteroidota bacterium]
MPGTIENMLHNAKIHTGFLTRLTLGVVCVFLCVGLGFGQITSNGTGGGDWTVPETWSGEVVPGPGDNVVISAGDIVTINNSSSISIVSIAIKNNAELIIEGECTFNNILGLEESGTLTVEATGSILYTGGAYLKIGVGSESNDYLITNHGTINVKDIHIYTAGIISLTGGGTCEINDVITFAQANSTIINESTLTLSTTGNGFTAATSEEFHNYGSFNWSGTDLGNIMPYFGYSGSVVNYNGGNQTIVNSNNDYATLHLTNS